MKVTTNVHDMNEQERLPHDYALPRTITDYRSSTDIVCFSDQNKETSFPYSAVRKVYFWNLLFGSGYYCHELEQEKRKQESDSSESGGNQYQHEQDYHRRPVVHRDDPMVVVSSSSSAAAAGLTRCHVEPKETAHRVEDRSFLPRVTVEPITCPICGGAHRKEKCWDDPMNAHLRPSDWMPSGAFLAKRGIRGGNHLTQAQAGGLPHTNEDPKLGGVITGAGLCDICKGPHRTEKCWDDPRNAHLRPSLDWRSKEEVRLRLHDRTHPSVHDRDSRDSRDHGPPASSSDAPPRKWRPPEDGENNKRVIDNKPHTYNLHIRGWVDDASRGIKWRPPEEGENDRRIIDRKPHNYNWVIKGWVVDPNFVPGSSRASSRGEDSSFRSQSDLAESSGRRGSTGSYGGEDTRGRSSVDDNRRSSYSGGGGSSSTSGGRYRDESSGRGGGGDSRYDSGRGGGGGGGDDYRRSSSYGGGGKSSSGGGDVSSSPSARYRDESSQNNYGDDNRDRGDRRGGGGSSSQYGGGGGGSSSPRYRDENSYDDDDRRYRDEQQFDKYRS